MKENSIEEDIECIQEFLEYSQDMINDMDYERTVDVTIYQQQINSMQHILSDYKRVLKENELLSKDIESWNKYCEEIEEERIEMSNKNCELEFEVEKLQKENEELKIKNNAIKRESEAYAEKMIRLDIEKQDYFEKYRYHLQQNESLTKEFSNVIPVQKVKDKIEELKEQDREWTEELSEPDSNFKDIDRNLKRIKNQIDVLQELLEGRKEREE